MKRGPTDIPERGERCGLRSSPSTTGVLAKYDPESNWATVQWDGPSYGPKLVHRFELIRLPPIASPP